MATSRIKCACKAETRPRIHIAIQTFEAAQFSKFSLFISTTWTAQLALSGQ
jgi:hypothetical protein